jgi:hypothetical protein
MVQTLLRMSLIIKKAARTNSVPERARKKGPKKAPKWLPGLDLNQQPSG